MKASNDPFFQSIRSAAKARARQVARRLVLPYQQREDIEQELNLDMLQRARSFDPIKGSAGTFTGLVSKHRANELMDDLIKERMVFPNKVDSLTASMPASNDPEYQPELGRKDDNIVSIWSNDPDFFANSDLIHDLEAAMAVMTEEQMDLFALLETHQDLAASAKAAKASGMSSATFYRRVEDLRMHLRMFGIRVAA